MNRIRVSRDNILYLETIRSGMENSISKTVDRVIKDHRARTLKDERKEKQ